MTDLVLSRSEIAELARTRLKVGQVQFLVKNGIRHYVDGHGWPVVLRSAVDSTAPAPAAKPAWRPNKVA
jgi:hypothetical protein